MSEGRKSSDSGMRFVSKMNGVEGKTPFLIGVAGGTASGKVGVMFLNCGFLVDTYSREAIQALTIHCTEFSDYDTSKMLVKTTRPILFYRHVVKTLPA